MFIKTFAHCGHCTNLPRPAFGAWDAALMLNPTPSPPSAASRPWTFSLQKMLFLIYNGCMESMASKMGTRADRMLKQQLGTPFKTQRTFKFSTNLLGELGTEAFPSGLPGQRYLSFFPHPCSIPEEHRDTLRPADLCVFLSLCLYLM